MLLFAEIVKGPGAGQIYPVSPGLRIGRGPGNNVRLADPKVSQNHAAVHQEGGALVLRDLGSRSGCRVNGELTAQIPLQEGLLVQMGNTWLRIASQQYRLDHPFDPSQVAQAEKPVEGGVPSTTGEDKLTLTPTNWRSRLAKQIDRAAKRLRNESRELAPLQPALELKFIEGRQTGTHWVLGYGPRRVGAASFELPILEPGSPNICFEIEQGESGPILVTPHPRVVQVNNHPLARTELHDGDTVSIGTTKILIKVLT